MKLTRREFLSKSFSILTAFNQMSNTITTRQPQIKENSEINKCLNQYESYIDEYTGAKIYRLIQGPHKNSTIYQTHPMWSSQKCERFYFLSDRTNGKMQLHCLYLLKKKIEPVFNTDIDTFTLSWKNENIFYVSNSKILQRDTMGNINIIGNIPQDLNDLHGGMAVSIDNRSLYLGAKKFNEGKYVLVKYNITTHRWEVCTEVNFPIGHIQTNPWNNDLVMFCWETGGDSPQRTWFWSDKNSSCLPFFRERDELWVTHEVWWGKNSALFTIWPYDEIRKKMPHGVCMCNIKEGQQSKLNVLSTYPAWHTHGSPNLQWVLGDDFERNIWLIDPTDKKRRLLVKGKISNGIKVHPHASFIPTSTGIVFNTSIFGYEEIHLVLLPKQFEELPTET